MLVCYQSNTGIRSRRVGPTGNAPRAAAPAGSAN